MASNHTEHYQLNQWEPEDKVLRTDFNADNLKIDGALAARNCQLYLLPYTGTGETGPRTFTFPHRPVFFTIQGVDYWASGIRGVPTMYGHVLASFNMGTSVVWGEKSVSLGAAGDSATYFYNGKDISYCMMVLLDLDH